MLTRYSSSIFFWNAFAWPLFRLLMMHSTLHCWSMRIAICTAGRRGVTVAVAAAPRRHGPLVFCCSQLLSQCVVCLNSCTDAAWHERRSSIALTSYGEVSILSPRSTSPRFSALLTILRGWQYGREKYSYGSCVFVDVSLLTLSSTLSPCTRHQIKPCEHQSCTGGTRQRRSAQLNHRQAPHNPWEQLHTLTDRLPSDVNKATCKATPHAPLHLTFTQSSHLCVVLGSNSWQIEARDAVHGETQQQSRRCRVSRHPALPPPGQCVITSEPACAAVWSQVRHCSCADIFRRAFA